MAKRIRQVRYYGDGNTKNEPPSVSLQTLQTGSTFSETKRIVQLGIQTIPGMKFYINDHDYPVVVGQTGIYELNVDGISYINNLRFDASTLNVIHKNQSNAYLIIDYLYEKEE